MIIENPENKLLSCHIVKRLQEVFLQSDLDTFSVRYDHRYGYIAEAYFAAIALKFFQKAETPNNAALGLARRIKAFCAEEKLAISQNSEGLILFVDA